LNKSSPKGHDLLFWVILFLLPSVSTYHPRVRVLGTVAESGSQGAGAALIVMCVLTVVDGTVDADGPHTRGVSVTVTVVLLSAIPGRPDVDIAQSVSALMGTHEQTSDMNEAIAKATQ